MLTESCDSLTASCDDNQKQFKGVFMRYLMDLADATGAANYRSLRPDPGRPHLAGATATRSTGSASAGRADPASNPNVRDWRTQASALSAMLAALPA